LSAQSQTFNATVSGIVYDSGRAVVPDAAVTITNSELGLRREFHTSSDGRYTFTLLPPGRYSLTVEKTGLRTYTQNGIDLSVGQSASLDVTLTVEGVTERVNVDAAAPLLNTSDANISSDVNQRAAVELPLNWRNVFGLVFLNSSVNNSQHTQWQAGGSYQGNADQDIAFFNFGGGRFGNTAFLLDGHWDVGPDWGGVSYVPGVDELQEFKVQTNTFSAQYGWSMGNVVNAITKSGTSTFHGDVFEFFRNSALDANNFFNNAAGIDRPQFKRNQFGVSAGGPLYIPHLYSHRDKTFFFGMYEGLRQQTPVTLLTTVPTADFRAGDFSSLLGGSAGVDALGRPVRAGQLYDPTSTRAITAGLVDSRTGRVATQSGYIRDPFAGNQIPVGMFDRVASNILSYWPSPNGAGAVNNYTATGGSPAASDQYTIRGDHNFNDNSRLFIRWSQKREYKQERAPLLGADNPAGPGSRNPNNRWDAAINFNHVFSPSLVMSFNWGWNRWVEGGVRQGVPFDLTKIGLPSFLNTSPGAFPTINADGVVSLGSGGNSSNPRENRTYAIDFTKVLSAHSLNFGFTFVDLLQNSVNGSAATFNFPVSMTAGPDPIAPEANSGFGFASFLLGTGTSGTFPLNAEPALKKNYFGWYLQDDWKVTPRLTLNLGARYDIQAAAIDRFDRLAWFDFNDANPISQAVGFTVPGSLVYTGGENRRGVYQPQYTNIAPRIGSQLPGHRQAGRAQRLRHVVQHRPHPRDR
jgi:hypothetical protein